MQTPLNAAAPTAGSLLSTSTFEVPIYQREYAWTSDEVEEFWNDLRSGLGEQPYFLGLVILTKEGERLHVVDGQQRILTLTMLAAALRQEAIAAKREALAERIQSDFLRAIDYETDATDPRVVLSDSSDNQTLQAILNGALESAAGNLDLGDDDSVSEKMKSAYRLLSEKLHTDLSSDPFKRLGVWTDFITNRLYFAVFIHPDPASAYKVFEAINTRGRDLTTADLLKNYVLSQTASSQKQQRYEQWQRIADQFPSEGTNSFVQYIRHVVTVRSGHILPKDLFDYLARRGAYASKSPPGIDELLQLLERNLPLYGQMIDPTGSGPADPDSLRVFSALNSLGVISVRPLLLAVQSLENPAAAARDVLRLVVRRIVVGNLGTGNVERRFSEAARKVHELRDWKSAFGELEDLNPDRDEFVGQLAKRSYNKSTLSFLRKSIVALEIAPELDGTLHFIRPRNAPEWGGFEDEDLTYWVSTVGNTILSKQQRRARTALTWQGFKTAMLPTSVDGEHVGRLESFGVWDASAVEQMGQEMAEIAGNVWY